MDPIRKTFAAGLVGGLGITLGAATGPAAAEGFTIADFGMVETLEGCVSRAAIALRGDRVAERDVSRLEWSVVAYDIAEPGIVASISCTRFDGDYRAILTVYSAPGARDDARIALKDRLKAVWFGL